VNEILHGGPGPPSLATALLAGAGSGAGAALLVVGEPGSGKSTLLDRAAEAAAARGLAVLATRGVEPESSTPFTGLHRLLRPIAGGIGRLQPAQADVLAVALRLHGGPPSDGFGVHAAALELLADAAAERPLLLRVDDADRLDRRSVEVLSFVAGRLRSERIAVLATARDRRIARVLPDVEVRRLAGLDEDACRELVERHAPYPVAPDVRVALARGTGGNPRALLDLLDALTAGQLAGAERLPDPLPLSGELARAYAAEVGRLPAATQRLLLLAATDPSLDAATLARAAAESGTRIDAIEPAESAGVARLTDAGVAFRHPLVRSACYQAASLLARQATRQTLAGAEGGDWHRAAAPRRSPTLAGDLDAMAGRTRARGDFAAAATALERAAELTPDSPGRAARLTTAAHDAWLAGQPARSLALLDRATPLTRADGPAGGRIGYLRGVIGVHQGVAFDAYEVLVAASCRLREASPDLALRALLGAGRASMYAGDAARLTSVAGRAAALARSCSGAPRSAARLAARAFVVDYLAGNAAVFQGRVADGVRLLRGVVRAAEGIDDPSMLVSASHAALGVGDVVLAHAFASRAVDGALACGTPAIVPHATECLIYSEIWTGRHLWAGATASEGLRLAGRTGQPNVACHLRAMLGMLAAIRGDEDGCRALAGEALAHALKHGLGLGAALSTAALGFLDLAHGRWEAARARLHQLMNAGPGLGHPFMSLLSIPHYVEAIVRTGDRDAARAELGPFERWAALVDRDWALALAARCRALLAEGDDADEHFREALRRHLSTDHDFQRGRSTLLYAEYLRRNRRRAEAREHLREAVEVFERVGADLWAKRARAELRATGERMPAARATGPHELTPQQLRIARCIADGATNREVASRLFLSPRTVDYHLRNIFTRLGISSRAELSRLLS
jgi:DNA-binding CsgD family transcriptional regulator